MTKFLLILVLMVGIIFNILSLQTQAAAYDKMLTSDNRMPASASLDNKNNDASSPEKDNLVATSANSSLNEDRGDLKKEDNNLINEDLFSSTKRVLFGVISSLGVDRTKASDELEKSLE